MEFKRIVAGPSPLGHAAFLDDLVMPRIDVFRHVPGFIVSTLWSTKSEPDLSDTVVDPVPSITSLVPAPGESRLVKVVFPPDSVLETIRDWDAAAAEYVEKLPGLAEAFEADHPGMHTTPTVDYVVLLSGELWLELDNDARCLAPGDVVIQNGTRHAWRDRGTEPATILSVMIGAKPQPG